MNTTIETAKGRVTKVLPEAWYCDCGCRTVYANGEPLGRGINEAESWFLAEGHYMVRKLRRVIDRGDHGSR